jgi:hypothetical protein
MAWTKVERFGEREKWIDEIRGLQARLVNDAEILLM